MIHDNKKMPRRVKKRTVCKSFERKRSGRQCGFYTSIISHMKPHDLPVSRGRMTVCPCRNRESETIMPHGQRTRVKERTGRVFKGITSPNRPIQTANSTNPLSTSNESHNITQNTLARSLTPIASPLYSMGNNKSKIEDKVKDVEGAIDALHRLDVTLAVYRKTVYTSEFSEELPKPNDPNLISSKKYLNMTYKEGIDKESIRSMISSVIDIPSVLESKKEGLVNAVTALTELTLGQEDDFAFSKAYTWRLAGDDGVEYLYAVVVTAAAINTASWGLKGGVTSQAAMSFVFKTGDDSSSSLPTNPKHDPNDPAVKKPLREIM
jgi:hypothetical protein